jgi:RNA polymerase sigma-70 factor (ECF subfamily)
MVSDAELVMRVAGSDDQAAFCSLVERHQAAIRRFLQRLLSGDHSTADDLAQQCFLQAYRKIHTWRASGSFPAWLHTIAYRQFLQHARTQARQQEKEQSFDPGFEPGGGQEVVSGTDVDAEMMAQQLMGLVSPEERACLTLSFAAGMSHAEICGISGLPLGTVKSHIQRGRHKLQKWLENNDHSVQKTRKHPEEEATRGRKIS